MRHWSNHGAMVVAGLMLAVLALPAVAQSPAIIGYSGDGNYLGTPDLVGWQFTVGASDIKVTHLGAFDDFGEGFRAAHQIGIWAVSNQALLGSTVLASGTVHPLESGFRWKELDTPIILSANTTYRIGEWVMRPRDTELRFRAINVTMDPLITYGGEVTNGSDMFSYPDRLYASSRHELGPNFKFEAVPEPAVLQLPFLIGLGGAGWWRRRRRGGWQRLRP